MGAPLPEMQPVENASAEALLDSLKTIDPGERRKHASVFNYWLSIRGKRDFPPIRDLDPLEISDAGPWSILLEMIGGGEDAVVRHFGQAIKGGVEVEKIGEAPSPSLLASIHAKLPIVAACREAYAFEESYATPDGPRRCWVTLLPFSQTGTWIDFVYGYVSLEGTEGTEDVAEAAEEVFEEAPDPDTPSEEAAEAAKLAEEPEAVDDQPETAQELEVAAEEEPETAELEEPEPFKVPLAPLDEEPDEVEAPAETFEVSPQVVEEFVEPEAEPEAEPVEEEMVEAAYEEQPETEAGQDIEPQQPLKPGFSKFLEGLAGGLYGKVTQSVQTSPQVAAHEDEYVAPDPESRPVTELLAVADEVAAEEPGSLDNAAPASNVEGNLQSKLTDVRALAAEAREAQIRSNIALYEGLSAAYDFALDAEDEPEEYLRLVEGQGLKIQLRSPMKPVVKLAFDGMCDEPTIKQLEAVLAWALKQDLPKGTLATRIQEEGGIGAILNGQA